MSEQKRIMTYKEIKELNGGIFSLAGVGLRQIKILGKPICLISKDMKNTFNTQLLIKDYSVDCSEDEIKAAIIREEEEKKLITSLQIVNPHNNYNLTLSCPHPDSSFGKNLYVRIHFTKNPTSNCQLFSIGNFDQLLIFFSKKDIETILRHVAFDLIGKPIMFFDINYRYLRNMEALDFESFNVNRYDSTNFSKMLQGNLIIYRQF